MMKITGLSHLFKWENLHNWWLTKYFFAPLYIKIYFYFLPRCRECLPEEWFCGDCDVLHHKKQPLHNRECVIHGFFEAIPPTSCVINGQDGYCIHEQGMFS